MSSRQPTRISLRRLHRWAGIAASLLLVLLAVSGLMLNHSSRIGLDARFVESEWLLDWYGIEGPRITQSFVSGAHYAALVGERLFVDGHELPAGARSLVGLLDVDGRLAVATDRELVLASPDGAVLDRLPSNQIVALGIDAERRLRLRTRDGISVLSSATLELLTAVPSAAIAWSHPAPLAPEQQAALRRSYRGAGLSLERLIGDLHSGRLLGSPGTLVMDGVALVAVLLAVSGLLIWLRTRP